MVSLNQLKVNKNTFSVPLRQSDDGGLPIQHFIIRFQEVTAALPVTTFELVAFCAEALSTDAPPGQRGR